MKGENQINKMLEEFTKGWFPNPQTSKDFFLSVRLSSFLYRLKKLNSTYVVFPKKHFYSKYDIGFFGKRLCGRSLYI